MGWRNEQHRDDVVRQSNVAQRRGSNIAAYVRQTYASVHIAQTGSGHINLLCAPQQEGRSETKPSEVDISGFP